MTDASKQLKVIEQIDSLSVGQALPSERAIVDDSFDIGLVLNFKSELDLQQYLTHPFHVEKVKQTLSPSCKRILVYDIVY